MDRVFRCLIGLVLIVACPATGLCAGKALSRSQAAAAIKQFHDFSNPMGVKVPVGNIWWDWRNVDDSNRDYPLKTLQDRGILTIRGIRAEERYVEQKNTSQNLPRTAKTSLSPGLPQKKGCPAVFS